MCAGGVLYIRILPAGIKNTNPLFKNLSWLCESVVEEKSEREETREERRVSIKGKHGRMVLFFCNRRYIMVFM